MYQEVDDVNTFDKQWHQIDTISEFIDDHCKKPYKQQTLS